MVNIKTFLNLTFLLASLREISLMGTYDVLIPPLPLISDSTNNNNIDMNHVLVHFTLDIQGALTFHVTRPMLISDKEGTNEIIYSS